MHLIGVGADGVEGLTPAARGVLAQARVVFGGARHLSLLAPLLRGLTVPWPSPIADGVAQVIARRGEPVVVLASGDPFLFGIGGTLAAHVPASEMVCLPAPSSAALACARLGWAQQDVRVLSVCGRPMAALTPALQPGARLLVLSADGGTPGALAAWLTERGFGPSTLHVFEALGGPEERAVTVTASDGQPPCAALNLVAVEVRADSTARVLPLAAGLDDDWFEHDGQITKREIRAVTLSSLAPFRGGVLWDVGSGSGSVAIEWMLRHPSCRAVAIERDPARAARIGRNAAALGVPALAVANAAAPDGLGGLPSPDAVFVGGGVSRAGVLDAAWEALRPGGRCVANAVTLEGEAALIGIHTARGGTLLRLGVERLGPVGGLHAFRPAMTVTQWVAIKP
ncbi:cobalamin biosynthesis protein precorrin-6Y C5,15-methyltransferase [Ameyamaea chiangmaiensis NBRC 103196]|nr:cobalamin biosynthesis protein precorrin-6Y C5,15-methyltransferase [Ameyamaea chiangmaiensis NBRC 103196]